MQMQSSSACSYPKIITICGYSLRRWIFHRHQFISDVHEFASGQYRWPRTGSWPSVSPHHTRNRKQEQEQEQGKTKWRKQSDCGNPFVKSQVFYIHFCSNSTGMGLEFEESARVASRVLILILSLANFVDGGVTSSYVRSANLSADMPLDSDVFRVPPGYNAPQQVSFLLLFFLSLFFCPVEFISLRLLRNWALDLE